MAGNDSFSFDTVAVLVAALKEKGVTLSTKEFTIMSLLDSKRGASAFDHQFRKVKKRAEQLKKLQGGTKVSPTKATPRKKAAECEEGTPTSNKRSRKNQSADAEGDGGSPTKKIKIEGVEEGGQNAVEEDEEFV